MDYQSQFDDLPPGLPFQILTRFLSERRRERLVSVASHRTKMVRLVLENLHDRHNVGACLRSAEAFGVLNVDVIQPVKGFHRSTTAKGASKWLNLNSWSRVDAFCAEMRQQNICLAGGMISGDQDLDTFPREIDGPVAIIFGNEHSGLSKEITENLDIRFRVTMRGMVESLNISVAAAVSMHMITEILEKKWGESFYLDQNERLRLLDRWVRREVRHGDRILAKAMEDFN